MTTVTLRQDLALSLQTEADRRRTSVETLVNDWLAEDLWEEWHRQIEAETMRYRALHAELRLHYADQVIALKDGEVVDSGDTTLEVYQRVSQRFGETAVLITRVGPDAVETYDVISPHLDTPTDETTLS